jgi:hypothetical protein
MLKNYRRFNKIGQLASAEGVCDNNGGCGKIYIYFNDWKL